MEFSATQLARVAPLWERMTSHPFLLDTRDGRIPHATFANWIQQDYLFVKAAIPFMGALLAKAPDEHRKPLADAIAALHDELDLFRERARAAGVDLAGVAPAFVCHAYIQFLLATAGLSSYPEAFTVLYVAEKAYHESWRIVKEGIDPGSPWMPFVENWAGDPFAAYVAWLEGELNRLAEAAGSAARERMTRLFELTVRYEVAFWELAYGAGGWPGIDADTKTPGGQSGASGVDPRAHTADDPAPRGGS